MFKRINGEQLQSWIGSLDLEPVQCDELTEEMVWDDAKTEIWQAKRFIGSPAFYSVYQWRDYYSYSPLSLLVKKGSLNLDFDTVRRVTNVPANNCLTGMGTLDREIRQLAKPMMMRRRIRTPEQFAQAIAQAMKKDIARAEANNPNCTNVVLCGGKDSLNMLLIPWKNPVIVASCAPNYPLVKQFLKDNDLPYDIIELKDDDLTLLPKEILINFCRNNLEHCRWGPPQVKIANDLDGKLIFWKGQLGRFMTPEWTTYNDPPGDDWAGLKRICSLWGGRGEYRMRALLKSSGMTQLRLFRTTWSRGTRWQGAHMSIQRQLTGALTLSSYHGREMRRVVEQVDLHRAVPYDIRPLIGELLHGRPVKYPETNPCPPPSMIRRGYSELQPFLEVLKSIGFSINNGKS